MNQNGTINTNLLAGLTALGLGFCAAGFAAVYKWMKLTDEQFKLVSDQVFDNFDYCRDSNKRTRDLVDIEHSIAQSEIAKLNLRVYKLENESKDVKESKEESKTEK
jgi:hypothetical protein